MVLRARNDAQIWYFRDSEEVFQSFSHDLYNSLVVVCLILDVMLLMLVWFGNDGVSSLQSTSL